MLSIYHRDQTVQEAIDGAARMARSAYSEFQTLEPELSGLGFTNKFADGMDAFVNGCRDVAVGVMTWK
jgi:hypothetical protein